MTIETKTNKNGQEMFYVDGKRVSKLTANAAESKNFDAITADVIGNTNVTVDNAKIRLDYALNGGITGTIFTAPLYFTSFENAIEAGKKIAAHFGEKLNAAYIGNITDDKIIATFYGGNTNPLINEIAKMPAIEDYAVSSEAQEIAIADEVTEKAATVENEVQVGTISICANAVGNGRVVIKVYGNHKCQPAKLDSVAAEMPRLSDIHIFASDQRNFNAKAKSYNGRYYAKANVYIFTNTSYGTDGFKKMYKFDTAKEAVRKLARQELDDKIITAEELEINETFKQSEDADKAFNRAWLCCESSGVQSPLKSKSDTLHAALDRICDELQPLRQLALTSELVDLYGRHDDLAGVKIVNINGTFKRVDVAPANVADLPAVNAKIAELKSVTHSLADEISDAQRSLERKLEQGDDTNLEQIAAVVAAKNRRYRNMTDELLTLKAAKHGAFANLLDKRDELTKQRHKLDLIIRNGLITVDEFNCKLAELDSEIRYVEIQIDALKSGDTFDYIDAAEHIKGVYEDVKTCIDLWSREHGLTVEQCEKIYVAAHIDRNFTADGLDNQLTAKLLKGTDGAGYMTVTCQDGAQITAHFKGAKVTVGDGYDILTARDRLLGHYDTPAQVKEVIDEFSKTIIGNRFEFPHVEDVGKSTVELAEELTALLLKVTPWNAGFMDLTLQDGKTTAASPRTAIIEPDWHGNGRFAFITPWNEVFARYDTASQVRTVIHRIKHAIEDKRDKFKYPTVAELSAPDYREKHWAVDFDIYHADSDLTDAELEDFTDKLRKAMTANGNRACVELEDCYITIYGDDGGDYETVDKIVTEMCKCDCWVEYPEDEGDANEKARLC